MKIAVVRAERSWTVEVDGTPVTSHPTRAEALATALELEGLLTDASSDEPVERDDPAD